MVALLDGNFILAIIILMLCLIMCFKRVPIVGVPIALVSIFLCLGVFLEDTAIPANPFFTVLVAVIALGALFANSLEIKGRMS